MSKKTRVKRKVTSIKKEGNLRILRLECYHVVARSKKSRRTFVRGVRGLYSEEDTQQTWAYCTVCEPEET